MEGSPPLLEESEADLAREAAEALLEMLPEPSSSWPAAMDGLAGAALFCHAAERPELARAYAAAAVERAGEDGLPLGLYHGLAGIGWAAATVAPELLAPSFDQALVRALEAPRWDGDYDHISGLCGIGAYLLRRGPAAGAVLDHLERLATPAGEGLTWITGPPGVPPTFEKASGPVAILGLAHGVPGVISLCASFIAAGVEVPRARRLLEGAVAFLFAHRLPPDQDAVYPPAVAEGIAPRPARSAWCYGDPGIAAALAFAAGPAGRPAWRDHARDLALKASARAPAAARIEEPALCHGASGLAHLFHRMFLATGEPSLAVAARDLFSRTVEMLEAGSEISAGLLDGASGIGLALLSAAGAAPPDWDAVLLLSAPPLGAAHPAAAERFEGLTLGKQPS